MLIHCSNRSCNTTTEHKLKLDTNEVICMVCANPNSMITPFIKSAMKGNGDLYKSVSKKAFMYGCKKCATNREVNVKNDKAFCKTCGTEVYVPAASLQALKVVADKFKDIDGDEGDEIKVAAKKVKIKKTKVDEQ